MRCPPARSPVRLLTVTVESRDGHRARRFLARHFRRLPGGGRAEVGDDRPQGGARIVELAVGSGPVRWRVAYERVDNLDGDDEDRAVVGSRIELAAGGAALTRRASGSMGRCNPQPRRSTPTSRRCPPTGGRRSPPSAT